MSTFKERQIKTWNLSTKLHEVTQKLMFDMLNKLTQEQLTQLVGYNITEYETIVSVGLDTQTFEVEDDAEENRYGKSFEDFTQLEQKELIDWIMFNIFKQ